MAGWRFGEVAAFYAVANIQFAIADFLTRGFDVHETLSLVGSERITVLHGVPTQMVMMIGADLSKYDLRSLRRGFFGGQTLADDVTRKVMAWFPEYFANVYGSTEALVVTTCDYRKHPEKLGSVGKAAVNGAQLYMQQHGDTVAGKKIQLIIKDDTSMADVAKRSGRVVQVGTQSSSMPHYREVMELLKMAYYKILDVAIMCSERVSGGSARNSRTMFSTPAT